MSKAKARINNNGLQYWILTNGENSVVFRKGKHSQGNVVHIDGWPKKDAESHGTWQIRQARRMWDELIRIGFWVEPEPEWATKKDGPWNDNN